MSTRRANPMGGGSRPTGERVEHLMSHGMPVYRLIEEGPDFVYVGFGVGFGF